MLRPRRYSFAPADFRHGREMAMRSAGLARWAIALCVLCNAGCGLVTNATHNLSAGFHDSLDALSEKRRTETWARQAWESASCRSGCQTFSEDYERGFKAGFCCYVANGGNGEPPALPPEKYRCVRYQSPQGYRAIEEWFAGYRHGVTMAREGGYRDLVTGPSSLRFSAVTEATAPPALTESAIQPTRTSPRLVNADVVPRPVPIGPPTNPDQLRQTGGSNTDSGEPQVRFRLMIDWEPWKLW
jgi:hypothetical protein